MRGYALDIEPAYSVPSSYTSPVIACLAAPQYPQEALRAVLRDGKDKADPETLWVCRRANRGTADWVIREELSDRNLLVLDTDKTYWGHLASDMRDYELVWGCSRVIVFHRTNSGRTQWFVRAQKFFPNITIVEEGK